MNLSNNFPKFFKVAGNLHAAVVNFALGDSGNADTMREDIVSDHVPLNEATAVGSRVNAHKQVPWLLPLHKPVLDIDIEHCYITSTTPGHAHLIINKEITWDNYEKLLRVLADCGIIEQGYLNAALRRKETWIRTPWTPKTTFNPVTGFHETLITLPPPQE